MTALIGVLIGGVIGYVAAVTTLLVEHHHWKTTLSVEHRRWRKEFNLQHLKAERIRQEEQCDRIRELLDEAIDEDSYSAVLIGRWIRLPQKIRTLLDRAINDIDCSQPEGKDKLRHEISLILGVYLGEIDKQIEELTQ